MLCFWLRSQSSYLCSTFRFAKESKLLQNNAGVQEQTFMSLKLHQNPGVVSETFAAICRIYNLKKPVNQHFAGFCIGLRRRVRDSNPRYPLEVYTLSRRAPSTTRTTLLERGQQI